ncbi:mannose-6-phosphate isomerase type 1 [Roseivirga ehrenbergii]|uniref:Phosphohexomutase n=1 Tax=Roseivirga ehrenbergii (strain DSM 102268 / JCM 13514 / KCTC 12282 / NCIMB 14502 / KMM 6017) TaxID=279360 RepID=A0A150XJ09_ROSEK|nr:type I phosphomannose isomerase catalytic subunit [Roseivirga ehrenbergii]KYG78690.1 mannose-6-phosphate isomerase [Roseivirga ehrenbergii]TCL10331.1 mannose-6-phosphate isomerase type 1 [Roseivirga ehrenbergii]
MTDKKYLYPLKFDTIFKEKIWGGTKVRDILGKDFSPLKNCGETWEISGVEGNLSKVSEGSLKGMTIPEITDMFKEEFVGKKVYQKYGNNFPLLIKFIDAAQDLSIQVHPNNKLAKERHNSLGKSEMWYVLQANKNAKLISGFNKDISKEEYLNHLQNETLIDILNEESVEAGDTFYLPAGRVHTIGKGLLIAEIQQSSDVTYRIYDFDRTDDEGNRRELHTEEAIEALDYNTHSDFKIKVQKRLNEVVPLVESEYFKTNLLEFSTGIIREHYNKDSFIIYVCLEGEAEITTLGQTAKISKGNAVLVPQKFPEVHIKTNLGFKMLETYLP